MFYDTFSFLCKQRDISPSKAATEAGISKSLVTKWKNNGTDVPSPDVLMKLSRYFGVTPDYLLGISTQSQIDTLTHQISQLRRELNNASRKQRENIEKTIFVLEESLEDLQFSQAIIAKTESTAAHCNQCEMTADEIEWMELYESVPSDHKKVVMTIVRAYIQTITNDELAGK